MLSLHLDKFILQRFIDINYKIYRYTRKNITYITCIILIQISVLYSKSVTGVSTDELLFCRIENSNSNSNYPAYCYGHRHFPIQRRSNFALADNARDVSDALNLPRHCHVTFSFFPAASIH